MFRDDRCDLNNTLQTIHNSHTIARDTAVKRINVWKDTTNRNSYIRRVFSSNPAQNQIVSGFIIDAEDVQIGLDHAFYLGMKEHEGVYVPDLIIYDIVNSIVVEGPQGVAEDVTVPVPPFPPGIVPPMYKEAL